MEFINIKAQYEAYKSEIDKVVLDTLKSGQFILGDEVDIFERELASFVGRKYAVSCSDGTAALQLIYMAYGIGEGDAVFCPDMTFIASVEPACMLGATPIFCDIDKVSYNISISSLEKQIIRVIDEGKLKPKAIVAVDFVGNPIDYEALQVMAKKYNLLLIEDAAQGIGGERNGKRCGSYGDVAATSFFPSKPLGAYGDGGAVFTDDEVMYELFKSLRVHGKGKSKYDNIHIGLNSRLDTIQAAILRVKLRHLEEEMKKRQCIAERYAMGLKDYVCIPNIEERCISSYAQYIIMVSDEDQRDSLMEYLKEKGIPVLQYYPNPLHMLPVFREINTYDENFENAQAYAKCSIGIPFSPFLTIEEQDYIVSQIQQWKEKYKKFNG